MYGVTKPSEKDGGINEVREMQLLGINVFNCSFIAALFLFVNWC
jgi:hypothetical protein